MEDIATHIIEGKDDEHDSAACELDAYLYTISTYGGPSCYLMDTMNNATRHRLTVPVTEPYKYSKNIFYDIMIDTGCAHASSGGIEQWYAYCCHVGEEEDIKTSAVAKCRFGAGSATSMGTDCIKFPVNHIISSITKHIIEAAVLLLLSLADVDNLRIRHDNLENKML